jgi:hypothetical protein
MNLTERVDLITKLAARDADSNRPRRRHHKEFFVDKCCILCGTEVGEKNRNSHESGRGHTKSYAYYLLSYDKSLQLGERDAGSGRQKRNQYIDFYVDGCCMLCGEDVEKRDRHTHESGEEHATRYAYYTLRYDTAGWVFVDETEIE